MIPFEIPAKFLIPVLAGHVQRYGGILKDVATGRIVGHLKEVGGLVTGMPATQLFGAASKVVEHAQLAQIQQTLNSLQLIATVGTVASVAGLGVSIAGFIVVNQKLKRIEGKLDEVANNVLAVRKCVEDLGLKWDAMTAAKVANAANLITEALAADTERRREQLLQDAARDFALLRQYYFQLFLRMEPWNEYDVPVTSALELFSRAVACGLGQLEAEFLLGDFGAFQNVWETLLDDTRRAAGFDARAAFTRRSDEATRRGISARLLQSQEDVHKQLVEARRNASETLARVETAVHEGRYLQHQGIRPEEYVRELRAHREPELILLPWPEELKSKAA